MLDLITYLTPCFLILKKCTITQIKQTSQIPSNGYSDINDQTYQQIDETLINEERIEPFWCPLFKNAIVGCYFRAYS